MWGAGSFFAPHILYNFSYTAVGKIKKATESGLDLSGAGGGVRGCGSGLELCPFPGAVGGGVGVGVLDLGSSLPEESVAAVCHRPASSIWLASSLVFPSPVFPFPRGGGRGPFRGVGRDLGSSGVCGVVVCVAQTGKGAPKAKAPNQPTSGLWVFFISGGGGLWWVWFDK